MNQEQKPRWRRTVDRLSIPIALLAVYSLILISVIVTDFFRGDEVDLWDWVGVPIIPVALAAGGVWLNNAQIQREEAVANQHAQDEALQRYLDQMSNLLIDQRLRRRPINSATHLLAQARTTTILLLDEKCERRPLKLVYRLGLIVGV